MGVWRNAHREHNVTASRHTSAHLSTHVHSYLPHPAGSTGPQSRYTSTRRPPSLIVLKVSVLCRALCHSCLTGTQRGNREFGRPSPRGRRWRITRSDSKLQESTASINCLGSVGSQCPLCRWGISCWWPTTGPHTPGGRDACKVISYGEREKKKVQILIEIET